MEKTSLILLEMNSSIQAILKKYWGYDDFRTMQEDIINSVLEDKDTLAILPTGGGKSICFQIPALAKPGICLVISPLIALMKDQVEHLKSKGIPSLLIYSGMGYAEVQKTLQNAAYGNFKFLYLSPERLESSLFLEYLPAMNINLIAVDEAHCISQWGYDFRPPYCRIAAIRESLPGVPVLALTASATSAVRDDICEKLSFKPNSCRFQKSFERPNLSYSAFSPPSKELKLVEILTNVRGCAIVYCKSRKKTKQVSDLLNANKINADFYHAGLSTITRSKKQESWVKDQVRVIVSTNAFGMGIDKSNVRVVVHYDVPDALESYYQEAGRAGRDEKRAYAVLLFYEHELTQLEGLSAIRFPSIEQIKKVYQALGNYLQLPSGIGEGIYYDLDITDFSRKFKFDLLTVLYSLKALEQEDLIAYNETVFIPSSVVFVAGRSDLEIFEKLHPSLDPVIKGLLRSYHGVLDFPAFIYERQLADFIRTDITLLKEQLTTLHQQNIIHYQPQKDKPQVLFLKNKVRIEELVINPGNLVKRKAAFDKRLNAMLLFVKTTKCRSRQVGIYFGDDSIQPCGICDNCIKNNTAGLSMQEFQKIASKIISLLEKCTYSLPEFHTQLKDIHKAKVIEVLNFLQSEDKVIVNPEGQISLSKGQKKGTQIEI